MKAAILLFTLTIFSFSASAQTLQIQQPVRFLALGDSYTIGQSVPVSQRWPVQLLDSLAARSIAIDTLRIIATTGWRTDNLLNAISNQNLRSQNYNLVSLLIGVNNQYQGRPFSQYTTEFPQLLDSAIRYAGGNPNRVFVVSIPDYAFTPFGQQSPNPALISQQLDQYNAFNEQAAAARGVHYFNITPISRQGLARPALVAADGLHPSGLQYAEWIALMLQHIDSTLTAVLPEKENKAMVEVFPQPAHERVFIRMPESSAGTAVIRLYSGTGQLLLQQATHEQEFEDNAFSLPVQSFPRGLYLLHVQTGGRQFMHRLLIE